MKASHIVGGGFKMTHLENSLYSFQLTLYYDEINGSPVAFDQEVFFTIYRKSDDHLMVNFTGIQVDENQEIINYTLLDCGIGGESVRTRVLLYQKNVILEQEVYNDPQGYYVVWERCCRNQVILNIQVPVNVGQTFLMEFPPVVKNSQPFQNSSPVFRPVPNTLFCIGQLSGIDFSASDADGDSLVFDLVDPIQSKSAAVQFQPAIGSPAPFPSVDWESGFSTTAQIPGNPSLSINPKTGIMTVKPNMLGLFVFSVRCSEYRNGTKIGEIRREFQQVVIDCPPNTAPQITFSHPSKTGSIIQNDTVFIENLTQDKTCFSIRVNDNQPHQVVTLRIIPLNFIPVSPIRGDTVRKVFSPSDTAFLNFCLPACKGSTRENPFHIRLLAFDNGCSGSLVDTLDFFLVLTAPLSYRPEIELGVSTDSVLKVYQGEIISFPVRTIVQPTQPNDLKAEYLNNQNVNFVTFPGLQFFPTSGAGPLTSSLRWNIPCSNPLDQPYTINFTASTSFCNQNLKAVKTLKVQILPSKGDVEILETSQDSTLKLVPIDGEAGITYKRILVGKNHTNTNVRLDAITDVNQMNRYGLRFIGFSRQARIESAVSWNPECSLLNLLFPADFQFMATSVTCGKTFHDTLTIRLQLEATNTKEFRPVNLLTVNQDGKNEILSLRNLNLFTGCGVEFVGISMYDRWGLKTFETTDPEFQWPADIKVSGTYFYEIRFNTQKFSGWIEVKK
ncbi:MAG TPA: gliding motility-associated C-terminal domain-containing protein [Catalimonadaceae bacterium]|nr:gliding motility-associated C-terminal domain-containing protein [Catalimonadaceae bacterium]